MNEWPRPVARLGDQQNPVDGEIVHRSEMKESDMPTTKQDLVDLICSKHDGLTKKAATELLDAVFDKITESIKTDEKFTYPGFGTFEIRTRRARTGVNPRNPSEKIQIPETKNVGFTASKALKDQIGA